jgi:hypothetical protein
MDARPNASGPTPARVNGSLSYRVAGIRMEPPCTTYNVPAKWITWSIEVHFNTLNNARKPVDCTTDGINVTIFRNKIPYMRDVSNPKDKPRLDKT